MITYTNNFNLYNNKNKLGSFRDSFKSPKLFTYQMCSFTFLVQGKIPFIYFLNLHNYCSLLSCNQKSKLSYQRGKMPKINFVIFRFVGNKSPGHAYKVIEALSKTKPSVPVINQKNINNPEIENSSVQNNIKEPTTFSEKIYKFGMKNIDMIVKNSIAETSTEKLINKSNVVNKEQQNIEELIKNNIFEYQDAYNDRPEDPTQQSFNFQNNGELKLSKSGINLYKKLQNEAIQQLEKVPSTPTDVNSLSGGTIDIPSTAICGAPIETHVITQQVCGENKIKIIAMFSSQKMHDGIPNVFLTPYQELSGIHNPDKDQYLVFFDYPYIVPSTSVKPHINADKYLKKDEVISKIKDELTKSPKDSAIFYRPQSLTPTFCDKMLKESQQETQKNINEKNKPKNMLQEEQELKKEKSKQKMLAHQKKQKEEAAKLKANKLNQNNENQND